MRKKTFGGICLVALGLMMGLVGCKSNGPAELLIGKWEVFRLDHGGTIMDGPSFKGTFYDFREDGKVLGITGSNHGQDSVLSQYTIQNDSLQYASMTTNEHAVYHIDTLTTARLILSINIEGIPTTLTMRKVKK
jgi:hypothetical protein